MQTTGIPRRRPFLYNHHTHSLVPVTRPPADYQQRAMAAMSDTKGNGYNRANTAYANPNNSMYANQYGNRAPVGQAYGIHNPATDLAALAHSFQGMNLQNQTFAAQAKTAMMSTPGNYPGIPMAAPVNSSLYGVPGQYGFANSYTPNAHAPNPNMYASNSQHYMPPMAYPGYQQHEHSPLSQQTWTPTTAVNETVPTLITPRRDSISSNENDQPATPSYAGFQGFGHGGVAIPRSPGGMYAHSTPSPSSMIGQYGIQMGKLSEQSDVAPHVVRLIAQEPAIPRAIPAPSSPLKPLDRALENQRGETNVYIRGLLPETTDEMLEAWGSRFGDIKSSKSIIDHNTGLCKGFGFVRYHNYEDAENCIRGFHFLGYEVSFARESFYSKLKTFADEGNTNLYVSNLPKSMNEHELAQLFAPHKVCSSRILRDKNGHGRGVGFARFESRDACEEVIKTFNNHPIPTSGEELSMQIRYADTQEQKTLKQQTQAARQFRSAEYEYATQAWRRSGVPFSGTSANDTANANEFEQYLGTSTGPAMPGQRWVQSALRQGPGRSPLGELPYNSSSQQPLVQINVAAGPDGEQGKSSPDHTAEPKAAVVTSPVTVNTTSPVDSVAAPEQQ